MSKVLVVYSTKSGCTEGVAKRIGAALACKPDASVEVVPAEEAPAAEDYDAVVVGSGIRVGQWHETARTWVSDNAAALRQVPVAFYTVGLMITNGAEKLPEVAAYAAPVAEAAGITPIDTGLFAGWNQPGSFPLVERLVLKAMKAPVGDFRDWDAIDSWAEKVAPRLVA